MNPGSVGQPRDRNPRAAYAIYDAARGRRALRPRPVRRRRRAPEDRARRAAGGARGPAARRALTGGLRHAAAAALAASLGGCLTFGAEPGPPKGTYRERLEGFARLLRMEDRRAYDPLLVGRTASSPDPWLRAKTALAAGRLQDPDASIVLPPLLIDADPSVRRAAAFAAGVSGDVRLVPLLTKALRDADGATARERRGGPRQDRRQGRDGRAPRRARAARRRRLGAHGARRRARSRCSAGPRRDGDGASFGLRRRVSCSRAEAGGRLFPGAQAATCSGARASRGSSNEGRRSGGVGSFRRRSRVGGAGIGNPGRRRERAGPRPPRGEPRRVRGGAGADGALFTF